MQMDAFLNVSDLCKSLVRGMVANESLLCLGFFRPRSTAADQSV